MKRKNLTEGSVTPLLVQLTIPMIFGILSIVAFNLSDAYFVGKLGTAEMAALTFTFPVILVINSINFGIGVGSSAVISKAFGQKNEKLVKRFATDSLTLGVAFAIIAMIIGFFTLDRLFIALGAQGQTLVHVKSYMGIWYAGVPFIVIPMIGNSTIRSLGDTKTPSIVMFVSAGFNMLLDPILIFGLGVIPAFGVKGAAIATVCSRFITFCFSLYILAIRDKVIDLKPIPIKAILNSWRQILFIGLPNAIARIITPIGAGIITSIIATYGKDVVAAYGIATRIEYFALAITSALASIIPVFIGQNFGAKKIDRIEEAVKKTSRFSLVYGGLIFLILYLTAPYLGRLFSSDQAVLNWIVLYLRLVPLAYGLQSILLITNGTLNVLHYPKLAASLTLIQMLVIYVPLAKITSPHFGIQGVFYSLIISFVIMGTISYMICKSIIHKQRIKFKEDI